MLQDTSLKLLWAALIILVLVLRWKYPALRLRKFHWKWYTSKNGRKNR